MVKIHISNDIIKPFSSEGDVVAWLKKVRLVVKLQQMDDVANLLPLYLEGDALALYMEMEEDDHNQIEQIKARLKEAFTDDVFAAYRKVTMITWAGERVNVYTNKIRQFFGLAGFKGDGLERLAKLAFITGFPNTVSIELQQAPNIEALTMGDLISRARVLTTTEEQNYDAVAATLSSHSSTRSSPITNVTCYRCNIKGHLAKDCRKCETWCYRCGECGHGLELLGKMSKGRMHKRQPSPPPSSARVR